MPWTGEAPFAGFSTVEPWLPLNSDWAVVNVEAQRRDSDSMLTLTRALLRLRRDTPCLVRGGYRTLAVQGDVLMFAREDQAARRIVALNLEPEPKLVLFGEEEIKGTIVLSTHLDRVGETVGRELAQCVGQVEQPGRMTGRGEEPGTNAPGDGRRVRGVDADPHPLRHQLHGARGERHDRRYHRRVEPRGQLQQGERHARQHGCPETDVSVEDLGSYSYRARGCGRSAIYHCASDQGTGTWCALERDEGPIASTGG